MKGLDFDSVVRSAVGVFGDQGRINGAAVTILTISFLASVVVEWRKQLSGHHPDWASPITRLVAFGLLLGFYSLVARSVIEIVSSLGDLQSIDAATAKKSVFAARAEAFSRSIGDDAELSFSNLQIGAAAFVNSLLDVVTYMTFTLAAACVFILKVIQKVMLNVLLTLGPIMIAFASIPGLTQGYLAAWLMGLVEVTAWGITGKIFLAMLIQSESSTTIDPSQTQNLAEHIVFNVVYGVSFLVIPIATATILRGSAAGLAQSGLSTAKGALTFATGGASSAATAVSKKVGTVGGGGRRDSEGGGGTGEANAGSSANSSRAGDEPARNGSDRRAAIARDAAIRKQERDGSENP